MKGKLKITVFCTLGLVLLCISAGPKQESVPPQPFYADFYTGTVRVQGTIPELPIVLYACVVSCDREGFKSRTIAVGPDGTYDNLHVDPSNKKYLYQIVTFYLETPFGNIMANEHAIMEGAFSRNRLDLTFSDPVPVFVPVVIPDEIIVPETELPSVGGPMNFIKYVKFIGFIGVTLCLLGLVFGVKSTRYRC
ncbi:MAG TPA: hypothetical protein DEZ08_04590 [Dehalococcoidia bacterium]|jgi:hypothetical protein|nr:hypothetical protein [Dehalococcoidia bacterium]|tara:strand:+ start:95 stop:673 length:579 start_codon:yes stop_codon:yes gene_type:complete